MKEFYGTLSETIDGLKKDGYILDFNVEGTCIVCHENVMTLQPEDFEIDKVYRFEGDSNPDDSAVIYAISSPKHHVKGIVVNAYSIYSDERSDLLVKKLKQQNR